MQRERYRETRESLQKLNLLLRRNTRKCKNIRMQRFAESAELRFS